MKKLKLAVIGADVSRSLSPQIHCFIAEKSGYCVEYDKISVAEGEFDGVLSFFPNAQRGGNGDADEGEAQPHCGTAIDGECAAF